MLTSQSCVCTWIIFLMVLCSVCSDKNYDEEIFVKQPLIRTEYDLHRNYNLTKDAYLRQIKRSSIKTQDVLEHYPYYFENSIKTFPTVNILAYVTPWNSAGYDMAKILNSKIQYLVPVWFQITRDAISNKIKLGGEQDVQISWMEDIRKSNSENVCANEQCRQKIKILPRINFETIIKTEDDVRNILNILVEVIDRYLFDGFTLELSSHNWEVTKKLPGQLKEIRENIFIVLVIPPMASTKDDIGFSKAFMDLQKNVDLFSVMTYDHNRNRVKEGANSPIDWCEEIMTNLTYVGPIKHKLLMGIAMYGWIGENSMTSTTMVKWLSSKNVTIQYKKDVAEHMFIENSSKKCYFPTPLSVYKRLSLVSRLGIEGIAIWELGQMMPYLSDIL